MVVFSFFLKYIYFYFLNLSLAASGLCCCAWAFSSCGECGLLFIVVRGLLIVVASHCRAGGLGTRTSVVGACRLSSCGLQALEHRLSSCGARASLLCGMWDLPGPGLEPVSPALAGGFLTTVPPGKSLVVFSLSFVSRYFLISSLISSLTHWFF